MRDVLAVNSAEELGQDPAGNENDCHQGDRPDELTLQEPRIALRGNLDDQLLAPDRPHRKRHPAGENSAHQLNRDAGEVVEPAVIEHARRPERRRRHDQAGGHGVEHETGGGADRETAFAVRKSARKADEDQAGRHRAGKSDGIAGDGAGRIQSFKHAGDGDQQQQRQMQPRPRQSHAEADRFAAGEFQQEHERYGHDRGADNRELLRIADHQRRQIEPFARAMKQPEQGEHTPGRLGSRAPPERDAGRSEQDECKTVKEKDEIELGVEEAHHEVP